MIRLDTILDDTTNTKNLDVISLDRAQMQKSRIRRQSKKGYDMGIDLPVGMTLYNGIILQGAGHIVTIQQMTELVCVIQMPRNGAPSTLVLLGHILGNLHRPIDIQNNQILLPIQDVSEEATFRRILNRLDIDDIAVEMRVFVPHNNANVSDHA